MCEGAREPGRQLLDRNSDLLHGVSVSDGNRPVLQALKVDGNAVGRADLVLPAVTPADALSVVVHRHQERAYERLGLPGQLDTIGLTGERQESNLYGRQILVEPEHHADLVLVRLFVVGIYQESQGGAVGASRRLDHVGEEALLGLVVEIREVLAAKL